MQVEVRHSAQIYTQEYEKGVPSGRVAMTVGDPRGRGTTIYFKAMLMSVVVERTGQSRTKTCQVFAITAGTKAVSKGTN